MSKKTIIALVVIIGVVLVWYFFFYEVNPSSTQRVNNTTLQNWDDVPEELVAEEEVFTGTKG